MAQNWNGLIRYIKRKLGVPLNFLELSDHDIIEIIKDDVLPAFGQYLGTPVWFRIGPCHLIAMKDDAIEPEHSDDIPGVENQTYYMSEEYRIPTPDHITIADVQEVFWPQYFSGSGGIDSDLVQSMGYLQMNPMDMAMMNTYDDMMKSMQTVPTFRYIHPDRLQLDVSLRGKDIIIECKALHNDLTTIPGDMYYEIFKPWALAEILDNVVQMRKKYRNMSTPFGELQLNWEDLQQRQETIMTTVQEKLDSLPPDRLLEWI